MKIGITGSAGFIGHHVATRLVQEGHIVVGFDDFSRGAFRDHTHVDINLEKPFSPSLFNELDAVIHLASKVGSFDYYVNNSFDVLSSNLAIDLNVIKTANAAGVRNFIYASSAHVYPPLKFKLKESDVFQDQTPPELTYGWAKIIGEELVKASDMNSVSLRLVGAFGPGQSTDAENGSLIPALCKKASDFPHTKYGIKTTGAESRTYCYIDDIVRSFVLCLNKLQETGESIPALNIGSEEEYSVLGIAKMIRDIADPKMSVISTDVAPIVVKQVCSNELAKKEIGWQPLIPFKEGLKLTYEDIESRLLNV